MIETGDLTTAGAAEYLGVSVKQFSRLAKRHRLKRVQYGHRTVRWPVAELDRMRKERTRTTR